MKGKNATTAPIINMPAKFPSFRLCKRNAGMTALVASLIRTRAVPPTHLDAIVLRYLSIIAAVMSCG
jgi:hypothetical protein